MIQPHEVYRTSLSMEARRQTWQQLTEEWKCSGQTQRFFCQSRGLKYTDLKRWLHRLKRQAGAVSSPSKPALGAMREKQAAFVPVEPHDPALSTQRSAPQESSVCIEHRSGFRIVYEAHSSREALRPVLETLQGLSC